MSTINYVKICREQNVSELKISNEENKSFRRKKQDPDKAASELRSNRREYRSNMCTSCFTAKASNGSCNC